MRLREVALSSIQEGRWLVLLSAKAAWCRVRLAKTRQVKDCVNTSKYEQTSSVWIHFGGGVHGAVQQDVRQSCEDLQNCECARFDALHRLSRLSLVLFCFVVFFRHHDF